MVPLTAPVLGEDPIDDGDALATQAPPAAADGGTPDPLGDPDELARLLAPEALIRVFEALNGDSSLPPLLVTDASRSSEGRELHQLQLDGTLSSFAGFELPATDDEEVARWRAGELTDLDQRMKGCGCRAQLSLGA